MISKIFEKHLTPGRYRERHFGPTKNDVNRMLKRFSLNTISVAFYFFHAVFIDITILEIMIFEAKFIITNYKTAPREHHF